MSHFHTQALGLCETVKRRGNTTIVRCHGCVWHILGSSNASFWAAARPSQVTFVEFHKREYVACVSELAVDLFSLHVDL